MFRPPAREMCLNALEDVYDTCMLHSSPAQTTPTLTILPHTLDEESRPLAGKLLAKWRPKKTEGQQQQEQEGQQTPSQTPQSQQQQQQQQTILASRPITSSESNTPLTNGTEESNPTPPPPQQPQQQPDATPATT